MFHRALDPTRRVRVSLMHFDIAIYEHHASSPAYSNVCELMNTTDSQCICITAATVDTVTIYITCLPSSICGQKRIVQLKKNAIIKSTIVIWTVECIQGFGYILKISTNFIKI